MPADIYGTLYPVQELDVAVAMIKDVYEKNPEPRAAMETTSLSKYNIMKIKSNISKRASAKVTFH